MCEKYTPDEIYLCNDYVSSQDMVQKAREYEKNADELEALENINDETNAISMNELIEEWGVVEKE